MADNELITENNESVDIVRLINCKRCGNLKPAYKDHNHICEDCAKAENSRVSFYRQHNVDWLDVAKEADLQLWERQPGETDREYQVWLAYRDAYPSVRPSYRTVAEQLCTTINVVKKVGQRWDFQVRMQAWAKHVDDLTLQQRQKEIVDMNKTHIDMATKLQEKLKTAIEGLRPELLEPKDITAMFKLVTEIERKARMDDPQLYKPQVTEENNPELREVQTSKGDIGQIVGILQQAGLIPKVGSVGIETTKRVIIKADE